MTTARFANHGRGMTPIDPHMAGHVCVKDGIMLRVDCERGIGWVATHYDLNLPVVQEVRGSLEGVDRVAASWARG